jgi:hypothetical protein
MGPLLENLALYTSRMEMKMAERERGYYWVRWSSWIDAETAASVPGPSLGLWDGRAWWFARKDRYYFDTEVVVLSECLRPPRTAVETRVPSSMMELSLG